MDVWIDVWIFGQMDRWTDGWIDRCMYDYFAGWMDDNQMLSMIVIDT